MRKNQAGIFFGILEKTGKRCLRNGIHEYLQISIKTKRFSIQPKKYNINDLSMLFIDVSASLRFLVFRKRDQQVFTIKDILSREPSEFCHQVYFSPKEYEALSWFYWCVGEFEILGIS